MEISLNLLVQIFATREKKFNLNHTVSNSLQLSLFSAVRPRSQTFFDQGAGSEIYYEGDAVCRSLSGQIFQYPVCEKDDGICRYGDQIHTNRPRSGYHRTVEG